MSSGALVLAGAGLRGRRRIGVLATFTVLVLAAVAISAGLVVSRQGARLIDRAAGRANVAHLVLSGAPDALAGVAADPEVVAWSGPFATVDDTAIIVGSDEVPMQITALDDPDIAVSRPLMTSGRWASSAGEIVIDHSVGNDLGLGVGDTVTIRRARAETRYAIVGTAVSFTDCFYPQCDPGRAWVTTAGFDVLHVGSAGYSQAWLRFDDPAQADPFVQRQAAAGTTGITGTESWLDTRADFLTLDRIFGSFVSAFGVFVLAVAAVVVAGSTAMRVVARRREIGLLGAIGCTPRQIARGLLAEHVVVGVGAGIVGWFLAGFLTPSLQLGIARTLGAQHPTWSLLGLLAAVGAITIVLLLATLAPAVSATRRPVTEVLRDVPRERVSRWNRTASGVPRRMSLLGVREMAGQPARSALAALAIVVAVVGTLVSIGFVSAIDTVAADPVRAGDPWDVAVAAPDVPSDRVEAALAGTPGITAWFSEVAMRSTFHDGAFLSVATGGKPDAAAYEIAGGRSMSASGEAIAGFGFLQRFDVAVGDTISILAGTTPITVRIVGWYRDTEDSGEVLRYRLETLTAAASGVEPEIYRVELADPDSAADVTAALARTLGPTTHTEILDTGVSDLAPLMVVLRLIAVVLLVMAGTNLLSTLLTANRETSRRVGTQLALGFTPRQITAQGAMVGAMLGLAAAVVGVLSGLWMFRTLADVVSESIGVGPGWMPAPGVVSVVTLVALAVVVSALLGALAVVRLARQPASDLVRGE